MEILQAIFFILLYLALLGAALALAWWAFRMVFWIVILFIGEAGKAWRGLQAASCKAPAWQGNPLR